MSSFKRTRRSNKGMSQHKNKAKVRWFGTKKWHGSVHFPPSNLIPSCSSMSPLSILPSSIPQTLLLPFEFLPPHQPAFHPKHSSQTELKKCGKAFHELFCSNFPLFLLVVTFYHFIEDTFTIKPAKNLFYPLL